MAASGFGLLTNLLMSEGSNFLWFVGELKRENSQSPPFTDATNVNVPISTRSRWWRISWHCNGFVLLYRQRAWVLFDNDRVS